MDVYSQKRRDGYKNGGVKMSVDFASVKQIQIRNSFFYGSPWATPVTENGVTIQFLSDEDCFLLNGTATSTGEYAKRNIKISLTPGKKYLFRVTKISGDYSVPTGTTDDVSIKTNWMGNSIGGASSGPSPTSEVNNAWFEIKAGVVFQNLKINVLFGEGEISVSGDIYSPNIDVKKITDANGNVLWRKVSNVWKKYNAVSSYALDISSSISYPGSGEPDDIYTGYTITSPTTYTKTGKKTWKYNENFTYENAIIGLDYIDYFGSVTHVYEYDSQADEETEYWDIVAHKILGVKTTYSQGTYIEDVESENENAYPTNGYQGGYWYVKVSENT